MSSSPPNGRPLGSLDGPSRTIIVEPVQLPATAPPPRVPEPKNPPAPKPERAPAR